METEYTWSAKYLINRNNVPEQDVLKQIDKLNWCFGTNVDCSFEHGMDVSGSYCLLKKRIRLNRDVLFYYDAILLEYVLFHEYRHALQAHNLNININNFMKMYETREFFVEIERDAENFAFKTMSEKYPHLSNRIQSFYKQQELFIVEKEKTLPKNKEGHECAVLLINNAEKICSNFEWNSYVTY